jgi:hypothetical protein
MAKIQSEWPTHTPTGVQLFEFFSEKNTKLKPAKVCPYDWVENMAASLGF